MYYEAVVETTTEGKKGNLKKQRETVLVDAMSVTEAEARVNKLNEGFSQDFQVVSVKKSKIVEVVTPDTKELAIRLAKKENKKEEGGDPESEENDGLGDDE